MSCAATSVSNSSTLPTKNACAHEKTAGSSKNQKSERLLEKVTLVVIAVFACMTSPLLFVGGAAGGMLVQAVRLGTGKVKVLSQPESLLHHESFSCGRSILERLADVKLPSFLGLAANVTVLLAHIRYLSVAFVPITGVVMGIWFAQKFGKEVVPSIKACCQKIAAFIVDQDKFPASTAV